MWSSQNKNTVVAVRAKYDGQIDLSALVIYLQFKLPNPSLEGRVSGEVFVCHFLKSDLGVKTCIRGLLKTCLKSRLFHLV